MGFYPITALFFFHCTFQLLRFLPPLASVLLFLCEPTFQYLFDFFSRLFSKYIGPRIPLFKHPGGSLLAFCPPHRQAPASIIRLPGSFVFSSAPHSSKFSRCGHNTQTGTPHPSATQGCCGLHQFFIICATSRRFRSIRTFLASKSPFPARSR